MRRSIRLIIALSITIGMSGITGRSVRATEYQVNRMDNQRTSLVLSSGLQVIKTENFEVWPTSGWSVVDLSNDGYDRRWDSHTYKYHTGARAIWPARGGDGRIPVPGYDDYFNNMNTRMTYGPFDLSDARQAEVRFWLWIDTQPTYDYLALEVSTTSSGSGFQEIARWSGSATSWQEQVILIPLDNRLDYSSVWIAWRFYSNSSTVADGPWVDDVLLRKYVAGQVTPQGAFSYYNRNSSLVGARYTKVSLFESDPVGGDDLLATTNTDANGFFNFLYRITGMEMTPIPIHSIVSSTCTSWQKPITAIVGLPGAV